jgi:metal-sulfur cluster biosynthetic enzyme
MGCHPVPDWAQTEYRNWNIDLPHIVERILSLAQHQGIARLEKREVQTSLKVQADVVMTDMSASCPMQETISEKVQKAIATALKQKGGSTPPKSELSIDNPCFIAKNGHVNRKR